MLPEVLVKGCVDRLTPSDALAKVLAQESTFTLEQALLLNYSGCRF